MRLRALGFALVLLGCGGPDVQPTPATPAREAAAADPFADRTDLPRSRPAPFEADLRWRSPGGDDEVLKLTEAGARYGLARGKTRVALRYRLDATALDAVYAALREHGFDRIKTAPRAEPSEDNSSLHVNAGDADLTISARGRQAPTPEGRAAYEAVVAAVRSQLPSERRDTVVRIRWDASMRDRSAAIDIELGEDLAGLHRVPDSTLPDVDLHLQRPRTLEVLLRQGSPAKPIALTVQAGAEPGLTIRYDATQDRVVAEPLLDTALIPPSP